MIVYFVDYDNESFTIGAKYNYNSSRTLSPVIFTSANEAIQNGQFNQEAYPDEVAHIAVVKAEASDEDIVEAVSCAMVGNSYKELMVTILEVKTYY